MGPIAKWILRRVVASGLAFEAESLDTYRRLLERLPGHAAVGSIEHLLAEEEQHRSILGEALSGRLDPEELERAVREHRFHGLEGIRPLEGGALGELRAELKRALAEEEQTFIFYGNLRRISKIPAVKRAFEILAEMEREHVEILRRLLGLPAPAGRAS